MEEKEVFKEGAIDPAFVGESIAKLQNKTSIGAHQIFLGQVRADLIDGKLVSGIDYSAYKEMAEEKFMEIRETTIEKYKLTSLNIYHSLGKVNTGEISLFVSVSSPHRRASNEAIVYLVEEIKKKVPIFGKEVLEDETYQWKKNN